MLALSNSGRRSGASGYPLKRLAQTRRRCLVHRLFCLRGLRQLQEICGNEPIIVRQDGAPKPPVERARSLWFPKVRSSKAGASLVPSIGEKRLSLHTPPDIWFLLNRVIDNQRLSFAVCYAGAVTNERNRKLFPSGIRRGCHADSRYATDFPTSDSMR